jgi:NADH-quinone oxidoreductase subunit J
MPAMEFKTILFYLFAIAVTFSAMRVVTARNPVHAALFLVLAFFSSAAIWMLLKAEFLAIVLVLVYVGAVMVLFLFVVMMLDINLDKLREGFWSYVPLATVVGAVIVLEMALVLIKTFLVPESQAPVRVSKLGNTHELGLAIFGDYLYAFELAGTILLLAMVAAVAVTLRHRKDVKGQNPAQQVAVRREDRVRMVKMVSEKERPEVGPGNQPEPTKEG